jgi:hypothetical protein
VSAQPYKDFPVPDDLFGNNGSTSQDRAPLAEMQRLQERMNRLFDHSFSRFRQGQHLDDLVGAKRFSQAWISRTRATDTGS